MKQPQLKLLVVRTADLQRLVDFYQCLGIEFTEHRHGTGPNHFAADLGEIVFEIYPAKKPEEIDRTTRLGFSVRELPTVVDSLRNCAVPFVEMPTQTEWGFRAVVHDPDGRAVELYAADTTT